LPIIQRLIAAYKLWHEYVQHFPRHSRYTLGGKIDALFIELIELVFIASYLAREQKVAPLRKAVSKLDLIKLLLQISWELRDLDNNKYISLSELLDEIGKMLGGWIRQFQKLNPAYNSGVGK